MCLKVISTFPLIIAIPCLFREEFSMLLHLPIRIVKASKINSWETYLWRSTEAGAAWRKIMLAPVNHMMFVVWDIWKAVLLRALKKTSWKLNPNTCTQLASFDIQLSDVSGSPRSVSNSRRSDTWEFNKGFPDTFPSYSLNQLAT